MDTPRALINKQKVSGGGGFTGFISGLGTGGSFDFSESNYRDALYLGDCDEGIWHLCKLLGWDGELRERVDRTGVVDWERDISENKGGKPAEAGVMPSKASL